MANPEHLKILKQGVEVWNRWREENEFMTIDLRLADLSSRILERVNLELSDLSGADLSGSKLSRADFWNSTLRDVDLRGADLQGARLWSATLWGADLQGAALSKVELGATLLVNIDLTAPACLKDIKHRAPSHVGDDTLRLTASSLSENRLKQEQIEALYRGAGLTEDVIEFYRLKFCGAIEFYSGFLSYSHKDRLFVNLLHDRLQARGIRCWLDEHDLRPGDRILDVVNDAIRLHDKILLCCSEASLNSWWVKDEIRKAQERERKEDRLIIIPLNLDGYLFDWNDGLESDLTSRLAADFSGWEQDNAKFEEQFEQVVRALRMDEGAREKSPESKL